MIVEFKVRLPGMSEGADWTSLEYGWTGAAPQRGDLIHFDGTDPAMPEGDYRVESLVFEVSLRGPQKITYTIIEEPE